jgi:SAM-dependent methyltransferase
MQKFVLHAKKTVAVDSPDHIVPWGTKQDNSRNLLFNKKLAALLGNKRLDILDFGCSGGGFVKSCIDQGHCGIGLEGSDYSQQVHRAEWATIPDSLFTCDITAEFQLAQLDAAAGAESDARFDVITAWEFIEHIHQRDLPAVCGNARRHLKPGGVWIMSVSPNEEVINGVTLHQTVEDHPWWLQFFESQGFANHSQLVDFFGDDWVRGPLQNAPGSFHLFLMRSDAAPPTIPAMPAYGVNDILETVEQFVTSEQLPYAKKLLYLAAAAYPDNTDIPISRGLVSLRSAQKEIARALRAIKQALEIDPALASASHLLTNSNAALDLLRLATAGDEKDRLAA